MAKIVAITPETISIGMENGELKEVPAGSLNFVPHIGDEVEVFESVNKIIVSKVEKRPVEQPVAQPMPTIKIVNTNTNTNINKNRNAHVGGGRAKNKWVAFLLCLLLGFLGAHKFYEGKTGMGLIYLCTMGLFGIGWILDCVLILFKPNPYYV